MGFTEIWRGPRSRFNLLFALLFAVFSTSHVIAAAWTEVGDAPDLLPGQQPLGTGPLNAISGTILGITDANLYKINIVDAANFSATVVSGPTYPDPGLDTLLWLFRADGTGVYANDDKGFLSYGYDDTSQLTSPLSGNSNGPTEDGIYYLAISSGRFAPFDQTGSQIFANSDAGNYPLTDLPGGVGPTSAGALSYWAITANDTALDPAHNSAWNEGTYQIVLTGTNFAPVPEPSAGILLLLAATLLSFWGGAASRGRK